MIWKVHIVYTLVTFVVLPATLLGEVVFRCPSCTAEQQAECPRHTETCAEIVREPGCGCCPVCARQKGELCGVYTPRCSSGLRCYPKPDSELPLEQLVLGLGTCRQKVEADPTGTQENKEISEVLHPSEPTVTETPPIKRPLKDAPWGGAKKNAVWQHRLEQKSKMKLSKVEESKTPCSKSQCQQELDHVLERISRMPFTDNRGPLEDLYTMHIPNCDKRGQYNLKQCKMSVGGRRGECWCVNPYTGRHIADAPTVRGNPNCSQYVSELETQSPNVLRK